MKERHFQQARTIRQQARAGWTLARLIEHHSLSGTTIRQMLAKRTVEGAAKVLDDMVINPAPTTMVYRLKNGSVMTFTIPLQL